MSFRRHDINGIEIKISSSHLISFVSASLLPYTLLLSSQEVRELIWSRTPAWQSGICRATADLNQNVQWDQFPPFLKSYFLIIVTHTPCQSVTCPPPDPDWIIGRNLKKTSCVEEDTSININSYLNRWTHIWPCIGSWKHPMFSISAIFVATFLILKSLL